MTIKELIEILQKYDEKLPVLVSDPVQGDSENCRSLAPPDLYLDERYPALVLF